MQKGQRKTLRTGTTPGLTRPGSAGFYDGGGMNKIDIVNELSEKVSLNQKVAKVIVDTIIDSIKKAIISGERVEIRGFGSFSLRSYKPYRGRNPKNGEIVEVPGKKLPYFKVGKELKEIIWKED
jgi:integration host factor subunit beta